MIYADFESLTTTMDQMQSRNTRAYQHHVPCSVGLQLVSSVPQVQMHYETYTGPNAEVWFLHRLLQIQKICIPVLFDPRRLVMTPSE